MLDDPARGRLVVVGRHDEESVDADRVRLARQMRGVRGRVGARTGDHRRAALERVDGDAEELEALVVAQRRALACCSRHDEAVRAVVDEVLGQVAEPVVIYGTVRVERCDDGG